MTGVQIMRPQTAFLPGFAEIAERRRLTPDQADALEYVGHRPHVTELSLAMALKRGGLPHDAAFKLVEGLDREGWIEVSQHRRAVVLTDAGRAVLEDQS